MILSSAILVIGFVMLEGRLGKAAAYLALITVTIIMNALLATVWMFFVGYRLFRL